MVNKRILVKLVFLPYVIPAEKYSRALNLHPKCINNMAFTKRLLAKLCSELNLTTSGLFLIVRVENTILHKCSLNACI